MHAFIIHTLLKYATDLPNTWLQLDHMEHAADNAPALGGSRAFHFHDEDRALVKWASQHQVNATG
jgi:hypothetical protein